MVLDIAQNILIIQLRQIGDVLLTTPVARNLRSAHTSPKITWLVEEYSSPALFGNPYVDEIITIPRRLSMRSYIALVRRLRKLKFDTVFDVQSNQKTGFLTWFSGAPLRIGFAHPSYKLHFKLFHNCRIPRQFTRNERSKIRYSAEYRLDVLRHLDYEVDGVGLDFFVEPAAEEWAKLFLSDLGIDGVQPLVGLSPGTRLPFKTWPVERFIMCGKTILDETRANILVLFGPGEEDVAKRTAAELGKRAVVSGSQSYAQHAALIQRLDVLVGNDGGNVHLATALGVPTVTVFGPTCPIQWNKPNDSHHLVLHSGLYCTTCPNKPCGSPRPCLMAISAKHVSDAVLALLERLQAV